jgi:hypothetical protein
VPKRIDWGVDGAGEIVERELLLRPEAMAKPARFDLGDQLRRWLQRPLRAALPEEGDSSQPDTLSGVHQGREESYFSRLCNILKEL